MIKTDQVNMLNYASCNQSMVKDLIYHAENESNNSMATDTLKCLDLFLIVKVMSSKNNQVQ